MCSATSANAGFGRMAPADGLRDWRRLGGLLAIISVEDCIRTRSCRVLRLARAQRAARPCLKMQH